MRSLWYFGGKEANASSLFGDFSGLPVVPSVPLSRLAQLINSFASEHLTVAMGNTDDISSFGQRGTESAADSPKADASRTESSRPLLHDLLLLHDTSLLFPSASSGSADSASKEQQKSPKGSSEASPVIQADPPVDIIGTLSAEDRRNIVRHVVSHLSGLERERQLVRAAAAASAGGARRREHSSRANSQDRSKRRRDPSNLSGSLTLRKQKLAETQSAQRKDGKTATAADADEKQSGRWSSWGGVWTSLGRGISLGGPASESATPATSHTNSPPATGSHSPVPSVPIKRRSANGSPARGVEGSSPRSADPSGALDVLRQRLADALPSTDASGVTKRAWNGAEGALKSLGAGLGLNSGYGSEASGSLPKQLTVPDEPQAASDTAPTAPVERTDSLSTVGDAHEVAEEEEAKDANAESAEPTAEAQVEEKQPSNSLSDADPAPLEEPSGPGETSSHTAPNVDLSQLAEAMNDRTPLATTEAEVELNIVPVETHNEKREELAPALVADPSIEQPEQSEQPQESAETELPDASRAEDAIVPSTAALSTGASELPKPETERKEPFKAFPSISITSAAWYSARLNKESGGGTSEKGASRGLNSDAEVASLRGSEHTASSTVDSESVQTQTQVHQDPDVDGWGEEVPVPFNSFRVYLGGSETLIPDDEERDSPVQELDVLYTTVSRSWAMAT